MEIKCKQCGLLSLNGTNFCSHKCRVLWKRNHNYTKKDWKHIRRQNEDLLIKMSGGTNQGNMGDHIKRG
jgi:hypothetical protein